MTDQQRCLTPPRSSPSDAPPHTWAPSGHRPPQLVTTIRSPRWRVEIVSKRVNPRTWERAGPESQSVSYLRLAMASVAGAQADRDPGHIR